MILLSSTDKDGLRLERKSFKQRMFETKLTNYEDDSDLFSNEH